MASCSVNAAFPESVARMEGGGIVKAGMGMGKLGGADLVMKRKFRWVFQITTICAGDVPAYFVKTASRPDLSIEETEINFLNAKTWIPGKASWEAITITYYDVATGDNINLWNWLASVYDFTNSDCLHMNSQRSGYAGTANLYLLDGCGNPLEHWTLDDVWPTSIKFGELDYSSSDTVDIELTLRYSQVKYNMLCPKLEVKPCPCKACV